MRDFTRAEFAFQRALTKTLDFLHAMFNLARISYLTGNTEQARVRFRRVRTIAAGNATLQHRRDLYFQSLGAR